MLAALIIVFREVFEAGLIVGIVLAVTSAVPHRLRWIGAGLFAGLAGACVVAAFAGTLTQLFEGMGQEVFNAAILSTAVIMLTWHNVWMARHGREMANELRTMGQAVAEGAKPLVALATVIAIAVLREGSEVALFLYGVAASDEGGGRALLGGGVLGLLLGVAVCLATYLGLMRIPPRALFRTTTVLITLLSAGMAAQAVFFLARANWLTWFDQVMWDSSAVLPEKGLAGRTLKALIGYTDQPTGMQLAVYVGVIVATIALMRLTTTSAPPRAVAAE
ncbi:transport-related membrane protein [Bradyrhizobium sp. SSBR45G]|uniref:FTR1 family iron permease n=1 Tax=unclassified Bradyrhizobium TaxID=2631580 RepID=UPI002342A637|nr:MULTISPECIES: FTR1 family protein [unclassified Bradyrhizobium]GLH76934.1 transport-related membrane protein [Bradyrhizobium sp. SSBR45G]GLH83692.1 transport-related membrane protein [Bradyrhizobium sp. SSBR45R]